jgi:hypothetical protein
MTDAAHLFGRSDDGDITDFREFFGQGSDPRRLNSVVVRHQYLNDNLPKTQQKPVVLATREIKTRRMKPAYWFR